MFVKILIILVAISFIISIIISISSFSIFELNENQLLYLFSMKGQIVGGVFALTLTAYIFFADKLREIGSTDVGYYDATLELRRKYFQDLIFIAVLVGASILFCVVGISTINQYQKLFLFVLNQSSLLFFICIGSVLYFGITLLNPKKIDNEVRELGKSIENDYPVNVENESASLEQFLTAYNSLEKTIMDTSEKLYGLYLSNYKQYRRYTPQIIQALKILLRFEVIDSDMNSEINEIRMFRNSIVHSVEDIKISNLICSRIEEINTQIKKKGSEDLHLLLDQDANSQGIQKT